MSRNGNGAAWRLPGVAPTTPSRDRSPVRAGRPTTGVEGEVVIRLHGPDGEFVRELSKSVFFPIEAGELQRSDDGDQATVWFPVRLKINGQRVDGAYHWHTVDRDAFTRSSTTELTRALETSQRVPRVVLDGQVQVSEILELEKAASAPAKPAPGKAGEDAAAPASTFRKRRYVIPDTFRCEIFDAAGLRVGRDGTRYRAQDGMPADE